MKKHLLILSVLFCSCALLKAQDQLFKKDNTKLQVKIIEIGTDDIKYKLFNNQSGPTYQESKSDFVLVIYENGQQEVINAQAPAAPANYVNSGLKMGDVQMSRADSLSYYVHSNSISLNFLNFFNNEVGLMYQREFYKSQFNIIVPVAFGVDKPSVTQSVYFGNTNNNTYAYNYNYNRSSFALSQKLYELGFGINYYPSLRTNVNYYIGPAFRFMQYRTSQSGTFYDPSNNGSYVSVSNSSILSRYCVSITNGFMIRTRSRININIFGSLGFKNDQLKNTLKNPYGNTDNNPISSPFSLYFWSGFNVGFSF